MRFRTRVMVVLGLAASVIATNTVVAQAEPSGFTVTNLHFAASGSDGRPCDVVADLYLPRDVRPDRTAPAILTTNGYGESKETQKPIASLYANRGYVVLAYSGLGFGGSGCRISFDNRDPDGKTASRLVDYLGGAAGRAYLDAAHTRPAPILRVVTKDARAHDGTVRAHDPRVGMVGGSYGGQIQFAAAALDPRIDTITPMATWNDLTYSMAPNNTGLKVGVSATTTGTPKWNWNYALALGGVASGLARPTVDPARLTGCPNFPIQMCEAMVQATATGVLSPSVLNQFRVASVATYLNRITIPTLLIQGQQDTLFNLNEAIATYRGLRAAGVPTKMIWMSGGHSATPQTGDFVEKATNPDTQYITGRVIDWMDHYLKGSSSSTGPEFAYFRDWVGYRGNAAPAYAVADTMDVGAARTYRLSGPASLAGAGQTVRAGASQFRTPPFGLPTYRDEPDAVELISLPERDVPGTYAQWDTPRLASAVAVVGTPTVRLRVVTPLNAHEPLERQLTLFFRVVDVDAAGKATTVANLVAPTRIADPTRPFTVTMPAIVHRFAPGHRVRLVISGGSTNYRGSQSAVPVTIAAGDDQTFTLPVVG